jgi:hypothetical protein
MSVCSVVSIIHELNKFNSYIIENLIDYKNIEHNITEMNHYSGSNESLMNHYSGSIEFFLKPLKCATYGVCTDTYHNKNAPLYVEDYIECRSQSPWSNTHSCCNNY